MAATTDMVPELVDSPTEKSTHCCMNKHTATTAIYWAFASLGLLIGSLGPSFLGLERQTEATAEQLAFVFTLRSIGYLVGSAGSGVFLDRHQNLGTPLLAICLIVTSTFTAAIPFASRVFILGIMCSTQGFAMGVLDTVGNVLILNIHGKNAGPWMQGLHFVFSVGALVSPLSVRLSMDLSASGVDCSTAFWFFAAITALGGFFFVFIPTPVRQDENRKNGSTDQNNNDTENAMKKDADKLSVEDRDYQKCYFWCCTRRVGLILTTGALLGLYVGAETGFGGFVLLYAQDQYNCTESDGQYLNAIFWGALAFGRALAIPLSLYISVTRQLIIDLVVSIFGCIILSTGAWFDAKWMLWPGTCIYGFGMASVFPCAVMQTEAFVDLSGRAASIIMVGSATGEMLVPLIVGVWTAFWTPGFVVGIFTTTLGFCTLAWWMIIQDCSHCFILLDVPCCLTQQ